MKPPWRQKLHLANLVVSRVQQVQAERFTRLEARLISLLEVMTDLRKAQSLLATCSNRGWLIAAAELKDRLGYQLRNLPYEFSELTEALTHCQQRQVPRVRDVLEELQQLEDEFGAYHYDPKKRLLNVTTDSIELEGVELGAFSIKLHVGELPHLARRRIYEVIALDPHPAASNDLVTHPHVSDGQLCEGEATAGIRGALEEGRLADFFLLVKGVLETYNADSPYVSLENWYGTSCHDCGASMGEDERCYCDRCDNEFCNDCVSSCTCCDTIYCRECLRTCPYCGEKVCSDCLPACAECSDKCCTNCLQDDLCPDCREAKETAAHETQLHPQPTQPETPQPAAA